MPEGEILNHKEGLLKPAPLNSEIKEILIGAGADHYGFADLSPYTDGLKEAYGPMWNNYPRAVSFGVNFPLQVVEELLKGPARTYLYYYDVLNDKINQIALALNTWLEGEGYLSFPIPASQRENEDKLSGIFSHRSAARLAGLGWIGKSSSLINPKVGPRLRLGTVLTNAPMVCDSPLENLCGKCNACRDICPPKAIKGVPWHSGQPLDERLNVYACDNYLQEMRHAFGKRICGLCIAVCPYGRRIAKDREEEV